jgi:regulator of replication initiation timing
MSVLKDIKSIFQKYNVSLEVSEPKEEPVQLMVEGILADGSSIFTDSDTWAVGVRAFTKDAEGNNVPLTDGEYELADGGVIKIAEGMVSEIGTKEAEDSEGEMKDDKKEEEMHEDMKALFEHITSLEAQIKSLNEKNTSLSAEVTKLSKQPALASIKDTKAKTELSAHPFTKPFHKMSYEEKVAFNFSKIKN